METPTFTASWTMAVRAVISLFFAYGLLIEKRGGAEAELMDVRNHLHDPMSFYTPPIARLSLEDAADLDAAAFIASAEMEADKEPHDVGARITRRVALPKRGPRFSELSLIEAETEATDVESQAGGEAGSMTCEISFLSRYDESPTVKIESSKKVSEPATAILIDEDANYWVHGVQGNIQIPSTFVFGGAESDGEYVSIHPPVGTGKHRYTALIYADAPQLGSMLSSLYGTPWHNKERAVGSLDAVESDLEKQNGKKPRELCRCSVEVSYEDVQSTAT